MKALQLHYTSCRAGRSGSPGFQVRAVSPGIGREEQREIERRGVYRPPRQLPAEPTPEQIARDFPKAFRAYRLESGRRALTLSCYTGQDYSGRWGNFFAHTLVLDGDSGAGTRWPDRWPVDYFEWEGWQHSQGAAEDGTAASLELPPVALEACPPAESFRLTELRDFLAEEPGRAELLGRMGRAVLLGQESSRSLVIRTDPLDGLYWVACVVKLFPPRHAWELSCSTYQDEPRGTALINATVEGTDFTFSVAERTYQFYMFDPGTGLASEVPDDESDYPALAARWLAEEPETLKAFFDSLHRFEPFPLDGRELLTAAELFRAGRGELDGLDGPRLGELLDFAARRATAEGRAALLEELGEVLLRSADAGRVAVHGDALRFLAEAAATTGEADHRRLTFQVWLRWLEESVRTGGSELDALEEGWRDLLEVLADHRGELAAAVLDSERLGRLTDPRKSPGPEGLAWLLERVRESLAIAGRTPAWKQPETHRVVAALRQVAPLETTARWILEPERGDAEALAGLAIELLPDEGTAGAAPAAHTVGGVLGTLLAGQPAEPGRDVRRRLEARGATEVLYGEWLSRLAAAEDPAELFAAYDRDVLADLRRYRDQARDRLAASVLEALGGEAASAQAARWVTDGTTGSFARELRGRCVTLANRRISLDPADGASRRLADQVATEAQELGLRLRPDHPWLYQIARQIEDAGAPPRSLRGDALEAALEGIDAGAYQRFLEAALSPLLETAGNYLEHQRRLLAVYRDPLRDIFTDVYLPFFAVKRRRRHLSPLQAAVKCWLLCDATEEPWSRLAPVEKKVRRAMGRGLARLPEGSFEELVQRLDKARLPGPARERWQRLVEQVRRRRKGVWRRTLDGLKALRRGRRDARSAG